MQLDPKTKVRELSVANQQMVEIAKVLSNKNPKLVIMDEPTAAISDQETEELFQQIYRLKNEGVSVVYISHRLEEIKRVGDRVTVMRDGKIVKTLPASAISQNEVIRLMVGREMTSQYPKKIVPKGKEILRLEHFTLAPKVKDISINLYESEVLGFAGLVGAGRTELMRALFGADKGATGDIYFRGEKIQIKHRLMLLKMVLHF